MRIKSFIYISLSSIFFISCKLTNEELINEGVRLADHKKYKEAIKVYTKAIKRNHKLQLAYYDRGFCFKELKDYSNALRDFNRVIDLQTYGDFIFIENPNTPFASEEAKMQVSYDDALYQRAQVKFFMDSLRSAFHDFQILIDKSYELRSNCILWQGAILINENKKDNACEYFGKAKQLASSENEKREADEMIKTHCGGN